MFNWKQTIPFAVIALRIMLLRYETRDGESLGIKWHHRNQWFSQVRRGNPAIHYPPTSGGGGSEPLRVPGSSGQGLGTTPSLPRLLGPERPWLGREHIYRVECAATAAFIGKAHLHVEPHLCPDRSILEVGDGVQRWPHLIDNYGQKLTEWWQLMQHHGARTRLLEQCVLASSAIC